MEIEIKPTSSIDIDIPKGVLRGPKGDPGPQGIQGEKGEPGTTNYNDCENKPSINDVELVGNKSLEDLGITDYVEQEIATFDFIKIVEELPETGLPNRTYFVPKTDPETNDLYDEYMWVNDKWELISTKQIEVDLTNYIKDTDYASITKAGVCFMDRGNISKVTNGPIVMNDNSGWGKVNRPYIQAASSAIINSRSKIPFTAGSGAIMPTNFDYAVKVAMCDGKGDAWTEKEKKNARERMGIAEQVTLTQTEYDALVEAGTVDENTYYYIKEE